jgi:3-oxoacyl-[acyl-carrier protein] reductase
MRFGLDGRRALVTAGSKGIGKAIAHGLAREGARVVICARTESDLVAAAEEIRSDTGAEVHHVQADVSVIADLERLAATASERLGGVDILVNNAGGPRPGVVADLTETDWASAIDTNLLATIRLTGLVLEGMRHQRWGRIVNIISTSAKEPFAGLGLSNVTRAGVVAWAKTLSTEVGPDNVLVNSIAPGGILTDRSLASETRRAEATGMTLEQVRREFEDLVPLRRIGLPEELANLAVFLLSDAGSYVTGTTIQVDGGLIKSLW